MEVRKIPENPCEEKKTDDDEICQELVRIFGPENVFPEWSVCAEAQDDMRGIDREKIRYCPEIDFVVGPLNIKRTTRTTNDEYNLLVETHKSLFDTLHEIDKKLEFEEANKITDDEMKCIEMFEREDNSGVLFDENSNKNPRTFLAIEIESTTSEKHALGGFVHASGMGKIGIVISPDDEERYKTLMKIRRYVRFLVAVGKAGDPEKVSLIKNILLLKRNSFLQVLREYQVN